MGRTGDRVYSKKKQDYFAKMNNLITENEKIVIVEVDNVTSAQLQAVRMQLRGTASMLLGKNTRMKKVLSQRADKGNDRDKVMYQKLVHDKLIAGNVGLIFTNADLAKVKAVLDSNLIQAPARQGSVAPVDVFVPAGNTGLEPTKTSFFQALNIPTKITKGTVEIVKDIQVIKAGEKVGSSEAALLQMLGIKPFFYGLGISNIYDNGSVYGAWVLSLTDEEMEKKCASAIANVTAFSLGVGIPTQASLPHTIMNAFKDILALSVVTNYDFDDFKGKALKEAVLRGPQPGAVAAGGASSAPAGESKPKEEEKKKDEEEEDDDMGFGLFD